MQNVNKSVVTALWSDKGMPERIPMAIFTTISQYTDLVLLLQYLDEDNYPALLNYIESCRRLGKFAKLREAVAQGTAYTSQANKYDLFQAIDENGQAK